jgi:hypothetical protein
MVFGGVETVSKLFVSWDILYVGRYTTSPSIFSTSDSSSSERTYSVFWKRISRSSSVVSCCDEFVVVFVVISERLDDETRWMERDGRDAWNAMDS